MATKFDSSRLASFMLAILLLTSIHGGAMAAQNCGQLAVQAAPCLNYLKTGSAVPFPCCRAVQNLNSSAKTTPDRQAACSCLKSFFTKISGIKPEAFASLPGKCGVKLPYKISPTMDCSKVYWDAKATRSVKCLQDMTNNLDPICSFPACYLPFQGCNK